MVKGVHRVGEFFVNFYLAEEDGRITIVDAGLPASWQSLLSALDGIGRSPGDIEALVLTHAHFDHIGFAERTRAGLGIPVWVHENDAPLTKRPWLYMTERSPLAYVSRNNLPIVTSLLRAGAARVGVPIPSPLSLPYSATKAQGSRALPSACARRLGSRGAGPRSPTSRSWGVPAQLYSSFVPSPGEAQPHARAESPTPPPRAPAGGGSGRPAAPPATRIGG